MRFVCTLPATSCCTHLSLIPVLRRVCSYSSHSPECPDHARTHGRREANTVHGQLSAGLAVSIFMGSTLTRRHATFKVRGDTGPANVILSLSLPHATCCLVSTTHVRKTTSVQLQPRIAMDSLTGRPSSATWVVHYTHRMQEIMHKIYFTLLWVWYTNKVRIKFKF